MSIKMAIIGMGGMAGWHFDNITRDIKEIDIVGGYDIQPETARRRAKQWKIKQYESPEAIYQDDDIDLVLIATPNDVHKDYIIALLKAGKHVICEKPVTMNVEELESVIAVANQTDKLFSIHQNRRWDADYMTIKTILADGLLHGAYEIESRVQGSKRLWGWRAFQQNGGGILLDWGVHLIDQMLDLVPEKVVSVYAKLQTLQNSEIDDSFTAMLRFEGGCAATINVSTNSFIVQPRWMLTCADGTAVVQNWECDGKIVKQADPDEADWTEAIVYTVAGPTRTMLPRPKETTLEIDLPKVGPSRWTDYYKNIVSVLKGDAEPIVTPAQALRVMKVIDAIFTSDRTGEAVTTGI